MRCAQIWALLSVFLVPSSASASVDRMVTSAEHLLEKVKYEEMAGYAMRFKVAADSADTDVDLHGVYGEMPLRAIAEVLDHDAVRQLADQPGACFADFGSGAGRLLLGVAAMQSWDKILGVEASRDLHALATDAIARSTMANVMSIHTNGSPHESPAGEALTEADVLFAYSTAFPSEDGLRLPELSASLACILRDGSVAITTDKFLVGDRFIFEAMLPVPGSDGETIHVFIWRVRGPQAPDYASALADVNARWMGEDACAQNEAACEALMAVLGDVGEDD
mmetsp:Transcript_15586/g.40309  ORF Transcript_15586/g.40309 Transcript_15586/m.40309 type:complete len:280 (+) Transcript_15586:160-999(+)|eukprot:CAMPEP_0115852948 /NCGR_PEP_ID=MMETSP0287-20121206/13254_1 /TAXON_ID=412157 /ORGANISM="Chrysochromulina rotalis, Strain UIO044" /LENGTH=279 /DNA_ID=CAMNT_0003307015 /DNA_START=161 /DNA_END=1000 /DNA_ORIENTATION=-